MTDGPLSQLIYMAFVWTSAASLKCDAQQMSLLENIPGHDSGTAAPGRRKTMNVNRGGVKETEGRLR